MRAQQRVAERLEALVTAQGEALRAVGRAAAARSSTVAVGGRLPLLVVVCAAPWLVADGWLSAGEVLGVATYLLQQLEPAVRTLAGMLGSWLLDLAVVLERLSSSTPPHPLAAPDTSVPLPLADGSLTVRSLRYAHAPGADPVLDGLEFTVPPGGRLAVVGPSGTGKSTLAALLAGMLAPDRGHVLVGGVELARVPGAGRASRLALVPQEAYVFAGSVRENLRWPSGEQSDRELADAAEKLGAAGLLARLGGPDGRIASPAALSAGERQLLALVRTFVSPAPVVVLDEATCHLDAAAERRAEEAFAERPGTLVVVAHRLGSAVRADRVLLLDGGRGVLAGHGDLQVISPLYRELVGHWRASIGVGGPAAMSGPGSGRRESGGRVAGRVSGARRAAV
ncbi:ATP-binding cassette domain-containing protein [Kitasatospora cheerisanensis]|uniref:ATP-binding cassette domain-containing protein n=1 Tax=Kitasatospora cheerisanensis TaxID=81942 RepID=UPI0006921743|nr:ABC transporter ATP-binding protein [Kitasatospora cheerisanensis]